MKYKYVAGNYPTTLQMYYDKYDEAMYKELFENYREQFKLPSLFNKFKYKYDEKHKFYVNFNAYLILDPETNTVVDYAFTRFHELVWIFQVLNIDNIEFDLNKKVAADIANDLEIYKDRIVPIE